MSNQLLQVAESRPKDRKINADMLSSIGGAPKATEIGGGHYAVTNIFGNIGFVVTEEGVVVVDAAVNEDVAKAVLSLIREITAAPIKYLIYTHGHGDHVKGAPVFKREGATIIAQRNVSRRFRRYTKFADYHARINGVQFAGGGFDGGRYWSEFVYPDIEYIDTYSFTLGGKEFILNHEYGETDDATVVTVKADGVVYAGDLIIWAFPNIGNPNKVLRYEHEWAQALDKIAAGKPQHVIPGHGPVLSGEDVGAALYETGEALRLLYEQAAKFINEGRDLDYIIENAVLPENIKNSKYIPEVYGTREFVLRGIHRRYTGWYDGNPSNLNPAPKADVAKVIYELIGNREKIISKAKEIADGGNVRLALHILDLALGGDPKEKEALLLKSEYLRKLGNESHNLFYVNFYLAAAERYQKAAEETGA
ncbi:MAG: MBL fold metallo-hydrolase [Treponema sp.]|nr:MBL fold metallo-hydrolase [Treponema sp.]